MAEPASQFGLQQQVSIDSTMLDATLESCFRLCLPKAEEVQAHTSNGYLMPSATTRLRCSTEAQHTAQTRAKLSATRIVCVQHQSCWGWLQAAPLAVVHSTERPKEQSAQCVVADKQHSPCTDWLCPCHLPCSSWGTPSSRMAVRTPAACLHCKDTRHHGTAHSTAQCRHDARANTAHHSTGQCRQHGQTQHNKDRCQHTMCEWSQQTYCRLINQSIF